LQHEPTADTKQLNAIIKKMEPRFFETQQDLRKWFLRHHDQTDELFIGFYKVKSGIPSVTYKQAVDEALCFGWIDGVVRRIDDKSHKQRYTPRRKKSIWSQVNIKRVGELTKLGLMHESGLRTFENRDKTMQKKYSFEQENVAFTPAQEKKFKANKNAWKNFQSMPPSYIKPATWWVISARQEATKAKRLGDLIDCSEKGLKIKSLRRPTDRSS
jgi:uncharacterized protein YdeI (YjbR/CyaY-like superfamily)